MSKESILQEADRLIGGDRASSYGDALTNFTRVARLWSVVLGVDVTPEQVGMCMVMLKAARQINKPKRDNLVDLAGYAALTDQVTPVKVPKTETRQPIPGTAPECYIMPLGMAPDVPRNITIEDIDAEIARRNGYTKGWADMNPYTSALMEVEKVVNSYLGIPEGWPVSAAVFANVDQFFVTVDLRKLMRALGGDYANAVDDTERAAAERRTNEKAFLAGAGVMLDKEKETK